MPFAIKDIVIHLEGEGCGAQPTDQPCFAASKCFAASGGCDTGNSSGGDEPNPAGFEILRQELLRTLNHQPAA